MNMDWFAVLVLSLIVQLGSDRFRDREAAHARLAKLGPAALPYLKLSQASNDAEIAARSRRLTESAYQVPHPTCQASLPWLDALPDDFPERQQVIQQWVAAADREIGCGSSDWLNYRHAVLLWGRDWLRQGKCRRELARLIEGMAAREVAARKANRWWWSTAPINVPVEQGNDS